MSIGAEDQRRRANTWRAIVATTLRSFGIADAEARPASRRSSDEAFTREPDVYMPGLGIHIKAAPVPWARVSAYLTRAVHEADERGFGDLPVLVRPAPAEDSADAYALMRLRDFSKLAKDAATGRSVAGEG